MMDLESIKRLNEIKGEQAKMKNLLPMTIIEKEDKRNLSKMSFIGNFRPKGFKLVNEYFVDNSGFGSANEPALTFEQFEKKVKEGHAYAIVESGQFQVWIAEFEVNNAMKRKQRRLRKKLKKIEEGIRFFEKEKQETRQEMLPSIKDNVVVYREDIEVGE
jgi:hypothetical protein